MSTIHITPPLNRDVILVATFTLLSWLGEVSHNARELPMLTVFSPENSIPALVSLILFLLWWRSPIRQFAAILLGVWATMHLVGGAIITVLPLDFLPFPTPPEQSLGHYMSHVVYGAAQLPLLWMLIRSILAERAKSFITAG